MSDRPMIRKKRQSRIAKSVGRPYGFTLIELMVAMLLGLVVIGGVTSVFLAGQQTYRTNEALGDVEEGSRTAFELLSRDIRDAGLTGCDNSNGRVADTLNDEATPAWYDNWNDAVIGYDDASTDPALSNITTSGAPVKGTSSVHLLSTGSTDVTVVYTPGQNGQGSGSSANFQINASTTELTTGDVIMVCDFDHATILQITSYSANTTVVHNAGNSTSPGNCSKGLGYPTVCSANGNQYFFNNNARVSILTAVVWYIGTNPVKGQSLYRLSVGYGANGVSSTPQEMVRNVSNMKIQYLQSGGTGFVNAAAVTNWAAVNSAQVKLTLSSTLQRVDTTTSQPLTRTFTSTTTVRNRVQ